MQTSSSPNIQTARIICGALMSGVAVFWAFAVLMAGSEGLLGSEPFLDPLILLAIVLVIALGAFATALIFRSKGVSAVSSPSRGAASASANDLSKLQTNLIIAWALLEGQAMIAGVFFMLAGEPSLLIVSALVYVIGFALTFPRAEWFAGVRGASTAQPR